MRRGINQVLGSQQTQQANHQRFVPHKTAMKNSCILLRPTLVPHPQSRWWNSVSDLGFLCCAKISHFLRHLEHVRLPRRSHVRAMECAWTRMPTPGSVHKHHIRTNATVMDSSVQVTPFDTPSLQEFWLCHRENLSTFVHTCNPSDWNQAQPAHESDSS